MDSPRTCTCAVEPAAMVMVSTVDGANVADASSRDGVPLTRYASDTSVGSGGVPSDAGSRLTSRPRRSPARSTATSASFACGRRTVPTDVRSAP